MAIVLKRFRLEVNIAFRFIGMAFFNQGLDESNNFLNIFHNSWMNGRRLNIELPGIFLESRDIFISNGFGSWTFGNRCLDNFVIDVSKVADIINLIPSILEITANGVKGYRATGVADMDIVIDGRTADIESYLPLFNRTENFLLSCQGIIDLYCHSIAPLH